MNDRGRERLLIAGGLFKQQMTDPVQIKATIDKMPDERKAQLKQMVDWVEEYVNAKMANER